jgi:hypothetical protein
MILMTVEHYSLLFRRYSHSPSLQLASDIVALGALLAVGAFALSYHVSDFVIPTVILWSYVRVDLPCYLAHVIMVVFVHLYALCRPFLGSSLTLAVFACVLRRLALPTG